MPAGPEENERRAETDRLNASGRSASEGGTNGRVVVLVDVSNVAYGSAVKGAKPQISYIERVLEHLASLSVRVVAIADATLRHTIDQPEKLEGMFSAGTVHQVPAATSADDSLWELWKRYTRQGQRAYILTNDKFPNERNAKESIVTWSPRIAHLFVGGELVLNPAIESLLDSGPPADSVPRESDLGVEGAPLTEPRTSGSEPSAPEGTTEGKIDRELAAAPSRVDPGATAGFAELVEEATTLIARYTQAPGGVARSVNFATVAHDLHIRFGGNFVARFALKRPKDLAVFMADRGLVRVSYKDATMYVEPTPLLDSEIAKAGLTRLHREGRTAAAATVPQAPPPLVSSSDGAETPGRDEPEVVRVSAGAPAPIVEIGDPETFLKLARDHHAMHIFHWPVGVYSSEQRSEYRSGGEFFFVSSGTSFRLWGRAYRSLDDYVVARRHGFRGADQRSVIGSRYEAYGGDIWRELEELVPRPETESRV
jgi:hypothetical protein